MRHAGRPTSVRRSAGQVGDEPDDAVQVVDDVVGAIPVHLVCGIWGTIAVVFTNSDASFGTQLYSIVVVGIFCLVVSAVLWFILKAVMGLRVSEEDEITGLDMAELGMEAYPEFAKG